MMNIHATIIRLNCLSLTVYETKTFVNVLLANVPVLYEVGMSKLSTEKESVTYLTLDTGSVQSASL